MIQHSAFCIFLLSEYRHKLVAAKQVLKLGSEDLAVCDVMDQKIQDATLQIDRRMEYLVENNKRENLF